MVLLSSEILWLLLRSKFYKREAIREVIIRKATPNLVFIQEFKLDVIDKSTIRRMWEFKHKHWDLGVSSIHGNFGRYYGLV